LAWRHPGFSSHVGHAIPFEDEKAIKDVACYLVRAPVSLKKPVYLDGHKAVLYRSRMNFTRPKLRGHGPTRVAGAHERTHPRPRPTSHSLLWLLREQSQGRQARD
jgi:hypothetical protein